MFVIYILTGVFGVVFLGVPFVVPSGPNRGTTQVCIMLTCFCCWIFWTTVYISQRNPLFGPRLPNTTLAWMSVVWGEPARLSAHKLDHNDIDNFGGDSIGLSKRHAQESDPMKSHEDEKVSEDLSSRRLWQTMDNIEPAQLKAKMNERIGPQHVIEPEDGSFLTDMKSDEAKKNDKLSKEDNERSGDKGKNNMGFIPHVVTTGKSVLGHKNKEIQGSSNLEFYRDIFG